MSSKHIAPVTFLLVLLGVGYLVCAYIRFYRTIGEKNLVSPYKQTSFTLENARNVGVVNYVALGDSLTAGVGSDDVKSTLVYQTALNLSSRYGRVAVVNLGQPGATSQDLIGDQLPQIAGLAAPHYITLLIGVNDVHNRVSVATYKSNLTYILAELLAKTPAQIVLVNLPYLGSSDVVPLPFSSVLDTRTKQFNKVIDELGRNDRIKVVDLYSQTYELFKNDTGYYAADHFHPSGEGYLLFGGLINAD
jgi:lysophospholipase L1-like esterase